MSFESILFAILAVGAVSSGVAMVSSRNPVMSAIFLIGNFFCLAGFYLLLHAQLLAVLQIVVYTGAIMVLVVFVIMLLNLGDEERLAERYDIKWIIGVPLTLGLLGELAYMIIGGGEFSTILPDAATQVGSVEAMGTALFGRFLLPFEVTSFLLLGAIVGAVILAKRKQ